MGGDVDKFSGWHVQGCVQKRWHLCSQGPAGSLGTAYASGCWVRMQCQGDGFGVPLQQGAGEAEKEVHYCAQLEKYLILAWFCIAAF